MGDEKRANRSDAKKCKIWRRKGGKEDQECDGRTALRGIWAEWEENGEQRQTIEGVKSVDGESGERNVRKERTMKRDDGNHDQPHR